MAKIQNGESCLARFSAKDRPSQQFLSAVLSVSPIFSHKERQFPDFQRLFGRDLKEKDATGKKERRIRNGGGGDGNDR